MMTVRKLKPDYDITGLLPATITLILFGIVSIFSGLKWGITVVAFVFILFSIFSLIAYVRTNAFNYLIALFALLFYGIFLAISQGGIFYTGNTQIPKLFMLLGIIFFVFLSYLLISKKAKWRGRDIFEIAAQEIREAENGFTGRPQPIDKIPLTKEELFGFAEYLSKNLVAFPFREAHRVVFVIVKMGKEFSLVYGFKNNYDYRSWISIDFEGNLTVKISQEDYLDYKENLTFDRLGKSLGNLFTQFFYDYKKGEGIRILDKLNEASISPFS